jgi:hypothetical protein
MPFRVEFRFAPHGPNFRISKDVVIPGAVPASPEELRESGTALRLERIALNLASHLSAELGIPVNYVGYEIPELKVEPNLGPLTDQKVPYWMAIPMWTLEELLSKDYGR